MVKCHTALDCPLNNQRSLCLTDINLEHFDLYDKRLSSDVKVKCQTALNLNIVSGFILWIFACLPYTFWKSDHFQYRHIWGRGHTRSNVLKSFLVSSKCVMYVIITKYLINMNIIQHSVLVLYQYLISLDYRTDTKCDVQNGVINDYIDALFVLSIS